MPHLFLGPQRIPDELAEEIGAGEALIVGRGGDKQGKVVWRVDLGRDSGGAFLGRGWPEFAAAHRVADGWHLALRHRGRGVLTVKAFDDSCCIRDFGAQPPPAAAGKNCSFIFFPNWKSNHGSFLLIVSKKIPPLSSRVNLGVLISNLFILVICLDSQKANCNI